MSLADEKLAFVALGANLPFAGLAGAALLAAALRELQAEGLVLERVSSVWETPAWPPSDQPPYCNAAAAFAAVGLTPQAVLSLLLAVERRFGRERRERNAARTLDLDLLAVGQVVLDEPGLTLPHPRLHERFFVLAPLAEIAPDWRHPLQNQRVSDMLAATEAQGRKLGPLVPRTNSEGKPS